MALTEKEISLGSKVSIAEGVAALQDGKFVVFRPEENLPEEQQYAVIIGD